MKAYVCDKCENVITSDKIRADMLILEFKTEKLGIWDTRHLCDNCKNKLFKWFNENEDSEE